LIPCKIPSFFKIETINSILRHATILSYLNFAKLTDLYSAILAFILDACNVIVRCAVNYWI